MEIALKDRANKMGGKATARAARTETDVKPSEVEQTKEAPLASDEDLDKYCDKVAEAVQAKLKVPDDVAEEIKKEHFKKLRCTLTVTIDETGAVKKLDLTKPSELDSSSGALQKAINACSPFQDVPHTKTKSVDVLVKYDGKKVKVKRP